MDYQFSGQPVSYRTTASTSQPQSPDGRAPAPCRHPRVQIVAREEDSEFVECLDCREVFDSSEFTDINREEKMSAEEP